MLRVFSSQERGSDGGTQAATDELQLLCFGKTRFLIDGSVDASLLTIPALFHLHSWVLTCWWWTRWCTAELSCPAWCAAGIRKGIVERGQSHVEFPPQCRVRILAACSKGSCMDAIWCMLSQPYQSLHRCRLEQQPKHTNLARRR